MNTRRYMPALLFVGSGCAALIYEIVWFQLLQLVIGSSAISLGVLLGTFMGGMCLGSLLLPRYIGTEQHPLRVYAYLEIGIGIFGLLILWGMPLLASAYTSIGTPPGSDYCSAASPPLFASCPDPPDGRDTARDLALGEVHA